MSIGPSAEQPAPWLRHAHDVLRPVHSLSCRGHEHPGRWRANAGRHARLGDRELHQRPGNDEGLILTAKRISHIWTTPTGSAPARRPAILVPVAALGEGTPSGSAGRSSRTRRRSMNSISWGGFTSRILWDSYFPSRGAPSISYDPRTHLARHELDRPATPSDSPGSASGDRAADSRPCGRGAGDPAGLEGGRAGRSYVRTPMLDALFIVVGCALFFVAVAYTYACDRL